MLKHCVKSLVTLVLALVAMGVISSTCSARDFATTDGSVVHVSNVAKRPLATTGEPDQPLSPPPPPRETGSAGPDTSEGESGLDTVDFVRWIGMVWAYWLLGAAF